MHIFIWLLFVINVVIDLFKKLEERDYEDAKLDGGFLTLLLLIGVLYKGGMRPTIICISRSTLYNKIQKYGIEVPRLMHGDRRPINS